MEINFKISVGDHNEIQEAIELLTGLLGTPTKSVKKKSVEAKKSEEPKKPEILEDQSALIELRKVLAVKAKDHREEIKLKLKDLGAKNLTTLADDKYPEFETFLNDLS